MKIRVLFVCLGNICRSPMAEGLFLHKVRERGLEEHFSIDSAGCGGWHEGEQPDSRSRQTAQRHGFTLPSPARQIRPRDVLEAHYIVVMDTENQAHVANMMRTRNSPSTLLMVRAFDPESSPEKPADVPDPYNGSEQDFENVYHMLDRSLDRFLEHLIASHTLR